MKGRTKNAVPPLVPMATAIIAGIMAGNGSGLSDLALCLIPLALLVLFFRLGFPAHKGWMLVMCMTLGLWSGYHVRKAWAPHPTGAHISGFYRRPDLCITGRVVSFGRMYPNKTRVVMACLSLAPEPDTRPGNRIPVSGRVYLNVYGASQSSLRYHDMVRCRSPVRPIRNFANPNGFDYKTYLRRKGISGSVHINARALETVPNHPHSLHIRLIRFIETKRNRFYDLVVQTLANTRRDNTGGGQILGALVTGRKERISQDIRDAYAKAGGSHILAISGLHLSILAFFFFAFFYRLLCFSFPLLMAGRAKKLAGLLTLFPLIFYTIFSGMSPSTLRAFAMTSLFMMSFLLDRENDSVNTLAGAAVILLLADPASLYSLSFQLSFSAVLFIILGFRLMHQYRETCRFGLPEHTPAWLKKVPDLFLSACLVTLLAGIGTFPLIARYFNLVSFIQIPANLVLVPVMGFICLPMGLAALLVMDLFPGLADILILWGGTLVDLCTGYIHRIIAFPFAWTRIATLSLFQVLVIYGILAFVFLWLRLGKRAFLFGGLMAMAVCVCYARVSTGDRKPDEMTVTILDVGQGSAVYIKTIENKHLLVDGGGFPGAAVFDTGRYIVAPFLWHQKITALDAVILTHPESDHMKGLVFIVENFEVRQLVKNHDRTDTPVYHRLMAACAKKNVPILVPGCQNRELAWGHTRLAFFQCNTTRPFFDYNDNSLVFRLKLGKFTMLFPGDIMENREGLLTVLPHRPLSSTVLLAPHHGSNTSSKKFFLDKVLPKSVIISCGFENRYGFPHPQVIGRYRERGVRIFRTDLHGAVTIRTNGRNHKITTQKGG